MIRYYCIYDYSLNLSNAPFIAADDKSAIRLVRNMLLSADDGIVSKVSKHCDLRFVGFFDEETCEFIGRGEDDIIINLSSIPLPDQGVTNEF